MVLPGKQGDEILKWLRSRGDRTPVVIFSSTNKHTLLVDEGYEADEYIDKAISLSEFKTRLEKVLNHAWGKGMVDRLTDRVSFNRLTFVLTVDGKDYQLNYMPDIFYLSFVLIEIKELPRGICVCRYGT
ncbi:MAG: hypothetical protein ACLU4N_08465 [Butyricimonas faecihominis]